MMNCKRHFIAACFTLMPPLSGWAEAPVVDDSENFAIMEGQRVAEAPVVNSKYDEPLVNNADQDYAQNDSYQSGKKYDDGPALVQ